MFIVVGSVGVVRKMHDAIEPTADRVVELHNSTMSPNVLIRLLPIIALVGTCQMNLTVCGFELQVLS